MAYVSRELTPDQKLYDMVDKIVIVKGEVSTDPTIWQFHIKGKKLEVDAEKLETMYVFRNKFLKTFDRPAPKIKPNIWIDLLSAFIEEKAEYKKASEESEAVFIARQVFEHICGLQIAEEPSDVETGGYMHEHTLPDGKKYYCIPSNIFAEKVQSLGFRIPLNVLSVTMSELGLKHAGTPRVRYDGTRCRSWCFLADAVVSERGD